MTKLIGNERIMCDCAKNLYLSDPGTEKKIFLGMVLDYSEYIISREQHFVVPSCFKAI